MRVKIRVLTCTRVASENAFLSNTAKISVVYEK